MMDVVVIGLLFLDLVIGSVRNLLLTYVLLFGSYYCGYYLSPRYGSLLATTTNDSLTQTGVTLLVLLVL